MKVITSLCLLLLVNTSVYAANICLEKADSTYNTRRCLGKQWEAADKELNLVYQKLLKIYPVGSRRKALIKAESDWIKFRDSECASERSQLEGGTWEPIVEAICVVQLTQDRTKQLKQLLNNDH